MITRFGYGYGNQLGIGFDAIAGIKGNRICTGLGIIGVKRKATGAVAVVGKACIIRQSRSGEHRVGAVGVGRCYRHRQVAAFNNRLISYRVKHRRLIARLVHRNRNKFGIGFNAVGGVESNVMISRLGIIRRPVKCSRTVTVIRKTGPGG